MTTNKRIEYRKDGSIKHVIEEVNGRPYKDYTFYKNGKIKREYNYRMDVLINHNNDQYNTHYVNTYL